MTILYRNLGNGTLTRTSAARWRSAARQQSLSGGAGIMRRRGARPWKRCSGTITFVTCGASCGGCWKPLMSAARCLRWRRGKPRLSACSNYWARWRATRCNKNAKFCQRVGGVLGLLRAVGGMVPEELCAQHPPAVVAALASGWQREWLSDE